MNKTLLFLATFIMVALLAFAACAPTPTPTPTPAPAPAPKPAPPPAPVEPIKLRYTTGMPPSHFGSEMMAWEAAEIEKRTGGRVKIEVYTAGELLSYHEAIDAVILGAVDMVVGPIGHWSGRNPTVDFLNIFFLVRSFDQWDRARDPIRPITEGLFDKMGVRFIHFVGNGFGGIASNMPLNKVEDFKGLKIRAPTAALLDCVEAMDAVPVRLAGAEVYDALGKKAVDGAVSGWPTFVARKYYEVAEYFVGSVWMSSYGAQMSQDAWNRLPKDIQQIVTEVFMEAEERSLVAMRASDKESIDFLAERTTVKILTPEEIEEWAVVFEPLYDAYLKKGTEAGFETEARQILDALIKAR